jgi:hypothetical protein
MELETPAGVEAFNLWTLWIMARLWEEFPRPQYFHNPTPDSVSVTSDHQVAGNPIGPKGHEQVQLFRYTLTWLIDEGFARGLAKASGDFAGVSLTTRGFSVLNQVPQSVAARPELAAQKPLGALMREAVVSHGVGTALAGLIQMMFQSPAHL